MIRALYKSITLKCCIANPIRVTSVKLTTKRIKIHESQQMRHVAQFCPVWSSLQIQKKSIISGGCNYGFESLW